MAENVEICANAGRMAHSPRNHEVTYASHRGSHYEFFVNRQQVSLGKQHGAQNIIVDHLTQPLHQLHFNLKVT